MVMTTSWVMLKMLRSFTLIYYVLTCVYEYVYVWVVCVYSICVFVCYNNQYAWMTTLVLRALDLARSVSPLFFQPILDASIPIHPLSPLLRS